ncbi:hypothetical protein J4438_00175 [Candidatus Woesearchaeota archaeon]|nr:hypothetical protein [Candidatus Woesearchaeota archaeon]
MSIKQKIIKTVLPLTLVGILAGCNAEGPKIIDTERREFETWEFPFKNYKAGFYLVSSKPDSNGRTYFYSTKKVRIGYTVPLDDSTRVAVNEETGCSSTQRLDRTSPWEKWHTINTECQEQF